METLLSFFQGFINLGAAVMLPVVIAILGLFFGMKLGQAIKSGLFVGIGFQGLCLAVNLLTTTIQPVMDYYAQMDAGYDVLEIGFAAPAMEDAGDHHIAFVNHPLVAPDDGIPPGYLFQRRVDGAIIAGGVDLPVKIG